jgi:hypothetical protein
MKINRFASIILSSSLVMTALGASFAIASVPPQPQLIAQSVASPKILRSGSFVTVEQDHPTQGQAKIISQNGKRYLEFDQKFTTAQGPDVEILLYRGQSLPVKLAEKDYLTLAKLQKFNGAQRYEIPANINLDDFQAVGIWCKKFNVTFGYAAL